MNHLRQPSFYHVACACAAIALVICASRDPNVSAPFVAHVWEAASRILAYAVSIALAAGPFALGGALVATFALRLPAASWPTAIALVALAPGCDCSMNGFVGALRRCPAPLAGAALMCGAACNPVALIATVSVLGPHAVTIRVLGGAVAAASVALLWLAAPAAAARFDAARVCAVHDDLPARVERALRSLLPAVAIASAVLALAPNVIRTHASPFVAAIAGALISPCSSADPVLARAFYASLPAQAAFIIAAQCADVRQIVLLARSYGAMRATLAAIAGVAGCAAAVVTADLL